MPIIPDILEAESIAGILVSQEGLMATFMIINQRNKGNLIFLAKRIPFVAIGINWQSHDYETKGTLGCFLTRWNLDHQRGLAENAFHFSGFG